MTSRITTLNMAQASLNKWEVWQSGYIDLRREIEMVNWCSSSFGECSNSWKAIQVGFHKTFLFTREEDATLFMLRWA